MFLAEEVVQEVSEGTFQTYVIALAVSGVLLLLLAVIGLGATTASRVISALIGLAFLGYGIYLEFFLPADGEFRMFYYAFIVPVLVIYYAIRSRRAKKAEEAASGAPPAM